jgi:hypothetical protein
MASSIESSQLLMKILNNGGGVNILKIYVAISNEN